MKDAVQGFIEGPLKVRKHSNLKEISFKMSVVVGKKKLAYFKVLISIWQDCRAQAAARPLAEARRAGPGRVSAAPPPPSSAPGPVGIHLSLGPDICAESKQLPLSLNNKTQQNPFFSVLL